MILRVAPVGWAFTPFEPGQYVSLGLFGSQAEKLIRRPYSISSTPENREFLEFYINIVPGGILTPLLFNLGVGDRIWLSAKVAGSFTLRAIPQEANVILIATGTGVAPYTSMLTSSAGLHRQGRIALYHGVRESRDLGYRSVFTALREKRPDFVYLPIVSRPQLEASPWPGHIGHLQDLWSSDALEDAWGFRPSPENTHVLLCGNPQMIESMIALLAREGFQEQTPRQPGQVHSEKYWPK